MTSISASGTADSARRHPPNGHTPTPAADHLAHRSHRRVDRCVPCQHPWRGHLATCPQDPARHLGRAREDTLGMPSRYQAMVLLASWCGLRLGELTELRRSDVDLGDGVIRVRRAMVCVRGEFRVTTPNQRRTSEMSTSRRTCCRQPITWQVTSVSTRTRWYSPPGMAAIWRRARCTRRAEVVAVRASLRRVRDPLPGRRLHRLAQHDYKATTERPPRRGSGTAQQQHG